MRTTIPLAFLATLILVSAPVLAGPLEDKSLMRSAQAGVHVRTHEAFEVEDDGEPFVLEIVHWTGVGDNRIIVTGPSGQETVIQGPALAVAMLANTVTIDEAPEPGQWQVAVDTRNGATMFEIIVHH